jgi:hypothetical protein
MAKYKSTFLTLRQDWRSTSQGKSWAGTGTKKRSSGEVIYCSGEGSTTAVQRNWVWLGCCCLQKPGISWQQARIGLARSILYQLSYNKLTCDMLRHRPRWINGLLKGSEEFLRIMISSVHSVHLPIEVYLARDVFTPSRVFPQNQIFQSGQGMYIFI